MQAYAQHLLAGGILHADHVVVQALEQHAGGGFRVVEGDLRSHAPCLSTATKHAESRSQQGVDVDECAGARTPPAEAPSAGTASAGG